MSRNVLSFSQALTIRPSVGPIDDLLKYAEDENIDGILFAAYIEKTFDSVDHNFMFAALKDFDSGTISFGVLKPYSKSLKAVS